MTFILKSKWENSQICIKCDYSFDMLQSTLCCPDCGANNIPFKTFRFITAIELPKFWESTRTIEYKKGY
jgi:Zn finger protein HypA/HybF involved in hydrogenase expression